MIELDAAQVFREAEACGAFIPSAEKEKIATRNRHGYMFTKFDPLVDSFLESIRAKRCRTVFEVGGAYGNVAEAALELGVDHYYFNDREVQHIQAFVRRLHMSGKETLVSRLHLLLGSCPEDVRIPSCAFDAILVNKVLHFFTPDTIDGFVRWLKKGLMPQGRVYVFNISPFLVGHDDLLDEYYQNKHAGSRFPGYFPEYDKSSSALTIDEVARPERLLFMELDTLEQLFLDHGFTIEQSFQLTYKEETTPAWQEGKDMVGIIASKGS